MCGIAFAVVSSDEDSVIARLEPNVRNRGPDAFEVHTTRVDMHKVVVLSSLLQMQGGARRRALLDVGDGRILLYNGEVYGGLSEMKSPGVNDGEVLLAALSRGGVAEVMSGLRGPWAFVYYDRGDLWWGRDVMGRKSLLMVREGPQVMLTSVAPVMLSGGTEEGSTCIEVPPGLYRCSLTDLLRENLESVIHVPWEDELLLTLADYERPSASVVDQGHGPDAISQQLLDLLSDAVERRCMTATYLPDDLDFSPERDARFMVLFSGGVDSTLIAALVHKALPTSEPIELCSICFSSDGTSPDRIGALDAYKELKSRFPDRRWKFIAVDSTYDELKARQETLMTLLRPHDSVMDFNIGGALWIATAGVGRLVDVCSTSSDSADTSVEVLNDRYVSKARVVFLGHGADELFGGYGRHRTRFTKGGWQALVDEIRLDVRRIWERNFGRDDRVVSDHGKEGRLPFMDERVIQFALQTPLGLLMDFSLPIGEGDKKILRACLRALGLDRASRRVKRAMQFGTRLAKASNEAMFGSNTQANRRHAGGRAKLGPS